RSADPSAKYRTTPTISSPNATHASVPVTSSPSTCPALSPDSPTVFHSRITPAGERKLTLTHRPLGRLPDEIVTERLRLRLWDPDHVGSRLLDACRPLAAELADRRRSCCRRRLLGP
ncbi:hypothetical protein OAX95_01005, partial [bacterium]|nr:hypothetical protein [bacterium]